jgi:hypothetical protein
MISKRRLLLLSVLSVVSLTGCRTILPGDQPSRLWAVYAAQGPCNAGGPAPMVPHPTRMVRPECGTGSVVVIPPLR